MQEHPLKKNRLKKLKLKQIEQKSQRTHNRGEIFRLSPGKSQTIKQQQQQPNDSNNSQRNKRQTQS